MKNAKDTSFAIVAAVDGVAPLARSLVIADRARASGEMGGQIVGRGPCYRASQRVDFKAEDAQNIVYHSFQGAYIFYAVVFLRDRDTREPADQLSTRTLIFFQLIDSPFSSQPEGRADITFSPSIRLPAPLCDTDRAWDRGSMGLGRTEREGKTDALLPY